MYSKISPPLELQGKKVDLRVERTHVQIRMAMLELLNEKEYHSIRVEDILQKALVNRATFYKYYTCKDDLIGKMIEAVKINLDKTWEKRTKYGDLNDFLDHHINTLYAMRGEILALWKVNTPRHHLRQDMIKMVSTRFSELSLLAFPEKKPEDLELQTYIFSHLALDVLEYLFTKGLLSNLREISCHLEQILVMVNFDFRNVIK